MTRNDTAKIYAVFNRHLEAAWEELLGEIDIPWLGPNVLSLAAEAACGVIEAVADTQDYLEAEDLRKESE